MPSSCLAHLDELLDADLQRLSALDRLRTLPVAVPASRTAILPPGAQTPPLLSFCSNDYLGLALHPTVTAALRDAASLGAGAGASRLVSGHFPAHRDLETDLARHLGAPDALLFATGYQTNVGVITALAGPGDIIVSDAANHASIIDGCRLSRSTVRVYTHCDAAAAAGALAAPAAGRRFLVTESLFSMDGDQAPLADLAAVCEDRGAFLIVDEAHALGVLGPGGRGLAAAAGVQPAALIGTLGKAFGTAGGFVLGSPTLRTYLVNRARTFIYATAPPPVLAAATRAAVALAFSPEGDALRERLTTHARTLRAALRDLSPGFAAEGPIFPLICGPDEAALKASKSLRAAGFFVQAIRPPTVPENTARLRVTVSAAHTPAEVSALVAALPHALPHTPGCASSPHHGRAPGGTPPPGLQAFLTGALLLGTDTNAGKTTFARALLRWALRNNLPLRPLKPIETGVPADPAAQTGARRLATAAGLKPTADLLAEVCPFRFPLPVAPTVAARAAGVSLDLPRLLAETRARGRGTPLLIETAGGLLTPLVTGAANLDLARALALPVLLVARNTLGAINHTALALAALQRTPLPLLGLVLVDTTPDAAADPCPARATNAAAIAEATGVHVAMHFPFVPVSDSGHDEADDRLADAFAASLSPGFRAALCHALGGPV